jgi:hypothetical protein
MARMSECGLEPVMDGIGNVIGATAAAGPHLLVGSHIETQNQAGWLDGALGVVAGLALARAGLPVDVAAWADEEGHYGGFIGSRSYIGELEEAEIDRLANRYNGKTLREALREAGLEGRPRVQWEKGRHKGFLEMHIEQGTQLEGAGLRIGVVTGIVAIWQWRITVEGQQDHAGGTTMAERRDAGPDRGPAARDARSAHALRLRAAQHLDLRAHRARPRRGLDHPRPGRGCSSSSATWRRRCCAGWRRRSAPASPRATGGRSAPRCWSRSACPSPPSATRR